VLAHRFVAVAVGAKNRYKSPAGGLTLRLRTFRLSSMRSHNEQHEPTEHHDYLELQLLSQVEDDPEVSQRELSRRVGIALGLTNMLLRNLVQKGYVRATHAHWKRWLYALTPEGVSRKIRLTAAYIHRVLGHYQRIRQTLREQLEPLALHKESRVAIYGTGEFAELVYLGLRELGIEEMSIFSFRRNLDGATFLGMTVHDVAVLQPEEFDRILVASLTSSESDRLALQALGMTSDKVITFFSEGRAREVV